MVTLRVDILVSFIAVNVILVFVVDQMIPEIVGYDHVGVSPYGFVRVNNKDACAAAVFNVIVPGFDNTNKGLSTAFNIKDLE
jgi:hypothetical protein